MGAHVLSRTPMVEMNVISRMRIEYLELGGDGEIVATVGTTFLYD
jgi:hypothetical protein